MLVPITDSTTKTLSATITGGGAFHVLAYYDGTRWLVAAAAPWQSNDYTRSISRSAELRKVRKPINYPKGLEGMRGQLWTERLKAVD
jgi:hypothetical protein